MQKINYKEYRIVYLPSIYVSISIWDYKALKVRIVNINEGIFKIS
jgi:hypothetical protein